MCCLHAKFNDAAEADQATKSPTTFCHARVPIRACLSTVSVDNHVDNLLAERLSR